MKLRGCARNVHVKSCFVKTVSLPYNVLIYVLFFFSVAFAALSPYLRYQINHRAPPQRHPRSRISILFPKMGWDLPSGRGIHRRLEDQRGSEREMGSSFCCVEIWPSLPTRAVSGQVMIGKSEQIVSAIYPSGKSTWIGLPESWVILIFPSNYPFLVWVWVFDIYFNPWF